MEKFLESPFLFGHLKCEEGRVIKKSKFSARFALMLLLVGKMSFALPPGTRLISENEIRFRLYAGPTALGVLGAATGLSTLVNPTTCLEESGANLVLFFGGFATLLASCNWFVTVWTEDLRYRELTPILVPTNDLKYQKSLFDRLCNIMKPTTGSPLIVDTTRTRIAPYFEIFSRNEFKSRHRIRDFMIPILDQGELSVQRGISDGVDPNFYKKPQFLKTFYCKNQDKIEENTPSELNDFSGQSITSNLETQPDPRSATPDLEMAEPSKTNDPDPADDYFWVDLSDLSKKDE
jgi:hypothetical protein